MFSINNSDILELERDLEVFARSALPHATRNTLNEAAFQARSIAVADVKRNMVLRNKWTEKSIRVDQARGSDIRSQEAIVGSVADYMADQEFGGLKSKRGAEGTPISTSYAAGQGMGQKPRTRLPRRANQVSQIRLRRNSKKGSSRKQRNLIAVREAAKSGRKFVFLDLERSKGIFKVVGGRRNPKIRMVQDLSRKSVRIPKNPWLKPAFDEATRMIPGIYAARLREQLRRRGLLT